jgi:peptidoglycan hydrolase-like protein with peptidoglycan-binding domain
VRPLRTAVLVCSAILAAGAVAAASYGFGGNDPNPASRNPHPAPATAPVTRTTLRQTQQVNGTISYGTPVHVSGHGQGTITWLPAAGTVLNRGQAAYQVDNRPVSLFYGDRPFYRSLHTGDTGDDVKELEQNLAALGYAGITVDTTYTAATATAVTKWQKDHSLTQDGTFDPATVVVAPTAVRVASVDAQPGDPAGGRVFSYSGTTRVVQVALDVALQNMAKTGTSATVTLPDGKTVTGTVATVGTVATPGNQPTDPTTIPVTITVADQSALGTLDQAPVTVGLVSASVQNVLTVPVAALVALADGGTGVEVVTGSTSRYVTVKLGMFAGGRVEISGDGIAEGTLVGVPS